MKATAAIILVISSIPSTSQEIVYPKTEKRNVAHNYFGSTVNDDYRWLEDDLSAETAAWVESQNEVTFSYLEKIPFRAAIKSRMQKLWNYEKISSPRKHGDFTYYYKNDGLQNQFVLYRKDKSGKEEIFLDPNTFSKDGSSSLATVAFTKDGSLVAYSVSKAGSDWNTVTVLNAITKQPVGAQIVDLKFSGISWVGNDGFYYSRYDKPKGSELSAKTDQHKLYYHRMGTAQKDDKVIFGGTEKRRYVGGRVTEDQRFLVISAATSTSGNELYVKDLSKPKSQIVKIVGDFNNDHSILDNQGTKLFIVTNLNAANKKIVTVDASAPSPENWVDLVPETPHVLSASIGSGFIFTTYMKDAVSMIKQYDYSGKLVRDIDLPGVGTVGGFSGLIDDSVLYYTFTNYISAGIIYSYNPQSGISEEYDRPKVDFNSDNYESKQVFYKSKDGTKIPMIITHKKGLKLDGKNPTMLYGYGGFNISLTPSFSVPNAVWLEQGGVYAVPNLRGGGEYGKSWHDAGTKFQKQNVFDDFIAAAEYLISEKYTSSEYLALRGGSNGGLLVGAVMTQRPELAKVALPAVGVLDMLRYHTFTAGAGWAYDYGTSEDSKEMFEYLKNYSPLHNVKKVQYPATLVTTGDHDDRVVPAHSFKFAATLQEFQQGKNPVLIRVEINAGHGAGKPVSKLIDEQVDVIAFSLYNMRFTSLP